MSWNASSDADFGGVAGYAIYRDGGASAIGTVAGSTTLFADTSVAPASTHTYTVAGFDAAGNSSPQSAPSNAASTPGPSVVGLWHLDELSGATAYDSSGRGHDGAIGGPLHARSSGRGRDRLQLRSKERRHHPRRYGSPSQHREDHDLVLDEGHDSTPEGGLRHVRQRGSATRPNGGEIKLEVQLNGQASCGFWGALGGKQLQAGPNLLDGQWHQVICVRDGTQIVETVDGANFSVTAATGAITGTDPVRFGAHEDGGDWYNGVLDEVAYSIG